MKESDTMTQVYRDFRKQLKAVDRIALDGEKILEIETSKCQSGIDTTATVLVRDGKFLQHRLFQDYFERVNEMKARATEKAIVGLHTASMANIESIKAKALAHYGGNHA